MLNKEECEKALNNLADLSCFRSYSANEYYKTLLQLIEEHFNPQPYKFEELKEGMWVWDEKENKCNKIISINDDMKMEFYYIANDSTKYKVCFEENRFYPVTKALRYQGKEDEY